MNTSPAHLDGLELADYSDDDKGETTDILIGGDHSRDVITGDVVKGESGISFDALHGETCINKKRKQKQFFVGYTMYERVDQQ